MGMKTGIEWTEATWNPIRGCSRVSEGCRNCYAETVANRFKGPGEPYEGLIAKGGQWNGQVMVVDHKLAEPCRWNKPRMIFVNSMSDLFHPGIPFEVVAGIFGIMAAASWHTFQVLTKRPDRMLKFFRWIDTHPERHYFDSDHLRDRFIGNDWQPFFLAQKAAEIMPRGGEGLRVEIKGSWPLENVWLGVSVEDQATANERIPQLLETPDAAVRWISAEPLLGQVDLGCIEFTNGHGGSECWDALKLHGAHGATLDWVVVGGESGTNARPMHPDWPRTVRDQCRAAAVPFLFKQWGEWLPVLGQLEGVPIEGRKHCFEDGTFMGRVGKHNAGRLLDGHKWDQYPEFIK